MSSSVTPLGARLAARISINSRMIFAGVLRKPNDRPAGQPAREPGYRYARMVAASASDIFLAHRDFARCSPARVSTRDNAPRADFFLTLRLINVPTLAHRCVCCGPTSSRQHMNPEPWHNRRAKFHDIR
ncbi:hypothetical protein MPTK1_2g00310 [Marchantia polymorpha subsp. ruderalis]|uniref:Uncharacterized protein n=1 Tax=Marchantia polymorpha TaxID=3197 RepID=A0A2R6X9P1_MARPO|nr:hypothetical protein MARPO_0028s0120 [Marchantia polymorpha]BBN00570.1 hypothetical protein Mp_2g00310 [Marchantia polymorpha subsp. ruderalis]|eukprot:PTQ42827.1 hypothetical protein MARPO_0028s0120 [Marchantia polymorpha]